MFSIETYPPTNLRRLLDVPDFLFTETYLRSNGFFGSDEKRSEDGRLQKQSQYNLKTSVIEYNSVFL